MEPDNVHDKYAVKVLKNQAAVGHVPREISRYMQFCLKFGGNNERNCDWRPRKQERKWNGGTVQIQTEETKDIFIKSRIHN